MLKRNTKTDSENDKNYLTVEEFNAIRRMDFPKDFLDFLEIGFRTGLRAADILNISERRQPYGIPCDTKNHFFG